MKFDHHHISAGIEKVSSDTFLFTLDVSGKLTHDDYDVFLPMLEAAIATVENPKIRFFLDATDMNGLETRAAWDDLKLCLKHREKFDKIAIFGNRKWQKLSVALNSWFISGDIKYFERRSEALEWLNQSKIIG